MDDSSDSDVSYHGFDQLDSEEEESLHASDISVNDANSVLNVSDNEVNEASLEYDRELLPIQCSSEIFIPITTAYRCQSTIRDFTKIPLNKEISIPIYRSNEYSFHGIFRKKKSAFYFHLLNDLFKEINMECSLQIRSKVDKILFQKTKVIKFGLDNMEEDLMGTLSSEKKDLICKAPGGTLIFDVTLKIFGDLQTKIVYENNLAGNPKQLVEDLQNLFESPETADITLCVGEDKVFAHRLMLCARSPVFKSMLEHPMKENQENVIKIDDVSYNDLKIFLRFLYTGVLSDEKVNAKTMYYIGDKYQLLDLRKLCGDMLFSKLTTSNCLSILELAYHHTDEDLKRKVMNFIRLNASSVVASDTWKPFSAMKESLAVEVLSFCVGAQQDNISNKRRRIDTDGPY